MKMTDRVTPTQAKTELMTVAIIILATLSWMVVAAAVLTL